MITLEPFVVNLSTRSLPLATAENCCCLLLTLCSQSGHFEERITVPCHRSLVKANRGQVILL